MPGRDDGNRHHYLFDEMTFGELGIGFRLRQRQHGSPVVDEKEVAGWQKDAWGYFQTGVNVLWHGPARGFLLVYLGDEGGVGLGLFSFDLLGGFPVHHG